MKKTGIWKEISLDNYSFIYEGKETISTTTTFFEEFTFKINNEYIKFPSLKGINNEKLLIPIANGQNALIYDYWIGTGKVNINGSIYEFKRKNSYSYYFINDSKEVLIDFEELNPFIINLKLFWRDYIDELHPFLFCAGFVFYITLKKMTP